MALIEYLGAIVLEVNGAEYEVESVDITHNTGRRLVKTMNRDRRPSGFSEGTREWQLEISAPVPKDNPVSWDDIKGAKLTIYPVNEGGKRESYLDCVAISKSDAYGTDNEAKVRVTLAAMNRIYE